MGFNADKNIYCKPDFTPTVLQCINVTFSIQCSVCGTTNPKGYSCYHVVPCACPCAVLMTLYHTQIFSIVVVNCESNQWKILMYVYVRASSLT